MCGIPLWPFFMCFFWCQRDVFHVLSTVGAIRIVVIQEWWGVDFEIKNHAVMISQLGRGYKALIPE